MIDKSLLIKLCTIVRVIWRFTISIFRESNTGDDWRELRKIFRKLWEDKSIAYNMLAQDDDKKKENPLKKQRILSLPGRNSKTGEMTRMLLMALFSGIIIGGSSGALMLYWGGFTLGGLMLTAILIFLVFVIPILNYQINNHYLGYLGERVVAEELNNLVSQHGFPPRQWHFFHSFFPEEEHKGDIDHVIVCPKGVFCVETKTRRKKEGKRYVKFENNVLTVDDSRDDKTINQAKDNAKRLRHFIERKCGETGNVKSIITFPGGWYAQPNKGTSDTDIFVKNPGQFEYFFDKAPDTLSQEQIDRISKVIKDRASLSLEQVEEIFS